MQTVSRETIVYAMSAQNKPVLNVEPGTQVQFQTWDCFKGQITSAEKGFDGLDWSHVNPATGPVFINGAQEGDVLSVKIDKIEVADSGVTMCGEGAGTMGSFLKGNTIKIVPIKDNEAHFSDSIKLPLNKMVGVIGVAPKTGEITCGVPDLHGGNMDCKEITEGATVLLPVNVSGALLAMGDIHAVMADGEVSVTGLEVNGSITVTINLIKNKDLPLPMLLNKTSIMTIASDEDLDKAVDMAVANMVSYLEKNEDFSMTDAVMLCSLVADVKICQVVDPKKTIRVEFPRKYLKNGGKL